MITPRSNFRAGNRQSPLKQEISTDRQLANQRFAATPITLPRVGAEYSFLDGRLLRDGEPQPVRTGR